MALDYLLKVEKARGKEAMKRIEADCKTQWQRGNKGEWGKWN